MASLRALVAKRDGIDVAAHRAATSDLNLLRAPSERQILSGNWRKGHFRMRGVRIAIENPMGTRRRPEWPELSAHYGYVNGTVGADGDPIDVYVRNATPLDWQGTVYVIDQMVDGEWDEHKCMVGWDDQQSACRDYLRNFTADWELGPVTAMTWREWRDWLFSGNTRVQLAKAWQQSETATSGLTAYTLGTRRRRRAKILYST